MRLYPKQYKYSFVYFVLHRNGMTPWVIFCLFAQYFVWQSVHCAMWSSNYIFFTAVLYSITWAYCLCLFIPMAANGHKVAAYYILSFHVLSLFIFTLTLSGRYFDNPHHPNENTFDLEQPGNFPKVVSGDTGIWIHNLFTVESAFITTLPSFGILRFISTIITDPDLGYWQSTNLAFLWG